MENKLTRLLLLTITINTLEHEATLWIVGADHAGIVVRPATNTYLLLTTALISTGLFTDAKTGECNFASSSTS